VGRGLSIIVCTMLLSGCALPVPVQIASWALDGISFLATEKSLTDHGISIVTQKDCALWRGLKGEEVCSDNDDAGTFAVAATQPTDTVKEDSTDSANAEAEIAALANFETAAGTPEISPAVIAKAKPLTVNGQRLMIAGKRIWTERLDADHYYVVGSFSNRNNARRLVELYRNLGPAVMASRLDGVEVYRVAVGPFAPDQKRMMRRTLNKAGISNAWAMRIDHRDWMLASPRELLEPEKSIAEVPAQPEKSKPTPKPETTQEIAETPDDDTKSVPSSQLIESDKRFLVIGSFSSADNARNYAKTMADLSPQVLSADTTDGWRHRVVIGPYGKAEGLKVRGELARSGIENIWALNLKPDAIIHDTLMAEDPDELDRMDDLTADEIAETPSPDTKDIISKQETAPDDSGDQMGWGVNLVKNILNMFSSSDTTDVVGIISALES
jgi:cell division protein FtsN